MKLGNNIHDFARELWPINRSITGDGVRETLKRILQHLPTLNIKSVSSGSKVFDWEIPKEWHVKHAFIVMPNGKKICDFSKNNLHLVGYSIPFKGKVNLKELKKHLYTLPEQSNAIPYITSYYKERWGFCLTQEKYDSLQEGTYTVSIDTKLSEGVLNYAELFIEGKSKKEIFLSTYVCHPSMANNELSGPVVLTFLAKWLLGIKKPEYSYRIVFVPETIGSITYLSLNYHDMKRRVIAGFNISCVGDDRAYSYLPSRNGETLSDFVAKHVLKWIDSNYRSYTWLDRGSDERQYCAPGVDLPVASIMRTKYGEYPEYHTSLDDLENVVTPNGLEGGYTALKKAIEVIENNKIYKVKVLCEPHMGKRGMYPTISTKNSDNQVKLMMNLISFCDGQNSLLDIADKLNIPIWDLYEIIENLLQENILEVSK